MRTLRTAAGGAMLHAAARGGLELRRRDDGGAELRGRFPYGAEAELAPGRREVCAARAFGGASGEVHLLAQHDFTRPLASTTAGTLDVQDGDDALTFEARISADVAGTSHGADALALLAAGLAAGLYPGFRVPPGGDDVRQDGPDLVRTVKRAELVELSVVTRPAFAAAQVEARSWACATPGPFLSPERRWRR